jgi:ferredoxin--NADP+ reductase
LTYASLNPIMVDGTGMCGGCRVTVGGKVRFACVDGPEFDAHQVDFDELTRRTRAYLEQERVSRERHECWIGLGK